MIDDNASLSGAKKQKQQKTHIKSKYPFNKTCEHAVNCMIDDNVSLSGAKKTGEKKKEAVEYSYKVKMSV
jgi:hypothetical protein